MNEPVAIRYDFDGYGYQYMDSGSGSDWQTRVKGELLYAHPVKEQLKEVELEATFNRGYKEGARDYANKCNPVKEYFEDEPQAEELYEILQSNVELTDEEMMKVEYEFLTWNRSLDKPLVEISYELGVFKQAVEILRKARD